MRPQLSFLLRLKRSYSVCTTCTSLDDWSPLSFCSDVIRLTSTRLEDDEHKKKPLQKNDHGGDWRLRLVYDYCVFYSSGKWWKHIRQKGGAWTGKTGDHPCNHPPSSVTAAEGSAVSRPGSARGW